MSLFEKIPACSDPKYRVLHQVCKCGQTLKIEARPKVGVLGGEFRVICFSKTQWSRYHAPCDFAPTEWCQSHEDAWQLWRLREQLENPQ